MLVLMLGLVGFISGIKNGKQFTMDEQTEHIKYVLAFQILITSRLGVSLVNDVLESLLERLGKVY